MMALATVLTVLLTAAVQRQTPPEFLGKVMAFLTAAANCASPLGQAAYGALFEGLPAWTVLMGAAMAADYYISNERKGFIGQPPYDVFQLFSYYKEH